MQVVLFGHPDFLNSRSMPRFVEMILRGMQTRGHTVQLWSPSPLLYRLPFGKRLKKWLGYLDQFVVFPLQVRSRLKKLPAQTLFIFGDQALGPWVPLVANRPHVIHVHDLMALCSALGEFVQNPTGWSGQQYQSMIRRGFGYGQTFISVSEKTRSDLHRFLPGKPRISEVIYNGLNFPFRRMSQTEYLSTLAVAGLTVPTSGFLLHVGGNQWYKNREGLLKIYAAYAQQTPNPLPLWMVGALPTDAMKAEAQGVKNNGKVQFSANLTDEQVCAAYSAARLLIFPSLAEGFGWPIAEAMACGCPVLTTGEAPMTEVGGEAAFYIPRQPDHDNGAWAMQASKQIIDILKLPMNEQLARQESGFKQVSKFDTNNTIAAYEKIYLQAIEDHQPC
ncbi:glycosyltransferase family 1 protein [Rhodoferax sp.]|uniref:glycosyltransferase family 4 protein n=1 Tax=Rhodoferax sp. TaxID=50421 RepID=UPI0028485B53|nr:glycosyltransferase family 1 protein [Rhodoferax sp.]MDR3368611.1 glycosyltransferase family 1 protein [Rhodoferax sp.]